jgi:hypothetical protein
MGNHQVLSLQELPTLDSLDLTPLGYIGDGTSTGPAPSCTFCSVTCFNTASDNEQMP